MRWRGCAPCWTGEGGTDNATIRTELRGEQRPGWVDIKATWEGFIAPAAEQHRVWSDADASFGREREVARRLRKLCSDLEPVPAARVQEVIDWLEMP